MAIDWRGCDGFDDDGYLSASVAFYDTPSPPHWAAFAYLERVGGYWATQAEAQAAAEAEVERVGPPPGRRPKAR